MRLRYPPKSAGGFPGLTQDSAYVAGTDYQVHDNALNGRSEALLVGPELFKDNLGAAGFARIRTKSFYRLSEAMIQK